MVFAVELPAPLHGRHVPWVRHHADHRVIPLGRGTDGAQPPGGKIAAYGAVGDGALGGNDGVRKRLSVLLRQAQYMKGQPLGGLSTDPRQTGKLFDQRLQRRGKILHGSCSFTIRRAEPSTLPRSCCVMRYLNHFAPAGQSPSAPGKNTTTYAPWAAENHLNPSFVRTCA